MTGHSGGCLCGAVRFQAEDVKAQHHACHCDMCRHWAGGPFMAVSVGTARFTGEENLRRYASSEWAERGFCGRCGSSLFYHLKDKDTYMLAAGAFDDMPDLRLVGEVFIDRKPDGYAFAGNLPGMTGAEVFAKFAPPGD